MATSADLQNMQNHLKLVRHAHNCFKREQLTINTNDKNVCTESDCRTMRDVLRHMTQCYDLDNCPCEFYYKSIEIKEHSFVFLFSSQLSSISFRNSSLDKLYNTQLFDL